MNATSAHKRLATRAAATIEKASTARTALIEALAFPGVRIDDLMDAALSAEGEAKPWDRLLKRIDCHGVREGLAQQRQECMETLLQYRPNLSTSLVASAASIADQEGLRRFLALSDIDIDDEDQAPAEAAAPTKAPEAAPKATPAQKRTLRAIRDQEVKLHEYSIRDGRIVTSNDHANRPRRDMVAYVIAQGWAQADTSTSLFHGQRVTLTLIGEAIDQS
ncbi:hypothetical protein ACFWVB_38240 [Streptomyces microflavus]|uniref:hypothetical protein n=1 Tax=Streptomyces microflavus TaxID=1919 RepID=UPI00364BAF5F